MRIRSASAIPFLLLVLTITVTPQPGSDDLTRVVGHKLERLTKPVNVHYSVSGRERAKLVANLLDQASRFHKDKSGLTTQFTVAVLDQNDWKAIRGERPYGALSASAKPHVIYIPADDESEIAKLWRQNESTLSAKQRQILAERGTPYIGIHELGHTLIEASRINVGNKWFNEFLATYYAYAFLKEKHPEDAAAWHASAKAFAGNYTPQYRTLGDLERLYTRVGSANYSWYQARFLLLAVQIHEARGYRFLTDVNRNLPKLSDGHYWLDELLKNPVPTPELLAMLDNIHPGFTAWADQMK